MAIRTVCSSCWQVSVRPFIEAARPTHPSLIDAHHVMAELFGVINIPQSGRMIVKREVKYDPELHGEDLSTLERFLADQSARMPKKMDPEVGALLPDNPLMIRADMYTEFKYIQRIMEICGKQGIQIWKLELAAAEHPDTTAAKEAAKKGD